MTAKSTSNIERIIAGYKGQATKAKNESKRRIRKAVFGFVGVIIGISLSYPLEIIFGFPPIYTGAVCGAIGGICGLLLG